MSLRHPFSTEKGAAARNASLPEPEVKGVTGRALKAAVEHALRVQQPVVTAHVARIRRNKPTATPGEVIEALGKQYLYTVGGTGAAAGGIAVVPGIGTAASLATGAAEVHGLEIEDVERRRALVLAVVLGEGGTKLMQKVTGGSPHWAKEVVDVLPLKKLGPLNQTLVRWFIKRYITRQGALAFGRALPLGVGAVVGAVGNVATARAVIRSTERAFGPPPLEWPTS